MHDQNIDSIETPVISTADLSRILGIPVRTLQSWSSKKTGPLTPVKIGKHLRWRTEDVRALIGGGAA